MLKSKVAVQVLSSNMLSDDTLVISEALMKQWKIPKGQHILLKFGSLRQHVKAIPATKVDGLRINQNLANSYGIVSGATLRFQYKASTSTISIGPLIGVLVSRDYPHMPDNPFGSITLFCKELVEACSSQGAYVYFFTPNQVGSDTHFVDGWIYAKGWHKVTMPVPDVINNRLTTRKLENQPSLQQFFQRVSQQHQTIVFNEKFLDKTEVFDALKMDSSIKQYLPESHSFQNFSTLKLMCSRYRSVFLKPSRGSLGKGIIRISRLAAEGYQVQYATSAGTRKQQFSSLSQLFSTISSKLKRNQYQIQQGLQLIDIQSRPVDFRALVQKNGTGKWSITSIVARIAGADHFVSNLARGGTLSLPLAAIARSNLRSGMSKQAAVTSLRLASHRIARCIDEQIPAHFGELGIDLALDTNGKVWLLEVNSKPSKNDNTPLTDNKIRPSVRMMIQYARYISGF